MMKVASQAGPSKGGGKGAIANAAASSADRAGGRGTTTTSNSSTGDSSSTATNAIAPHFGADSVKMIAESIGIANLADDAARSIAEDITMKLKCIVQDAAKYTSHGRRSQLNIRDIEFALKNKNIPPMFGFNDPEQLPFRYASGGGRELFFQEDKEVELSDIVNASTLAKLPQDVALKNHWLSIDGVQPAIPDNPPPLSKDRQRIESIDPVQVLRNSSAFSNSAQNRFISQKKKKMVEVIKVKQYATHELSVEQQLYYKEITEACVGSDENRRSEALQSLMFDSGLHQMLPRLCTFISEGVKVNVVQNNLALLIYLMRMVKALLDNHNLYLEKYLHELIPTVITCIVSKQLCLRPEQDNHWALRDFGSRLLTQICRNFNTNTNNIQVRVTQLLASALDKDRPILPSMYGAISCFCEMGIEVQRTFLLKRIKPIGEKLRVLEVNANAQDKSAIDHIKTLISKVLPTTIKTMRPPPETLEEFNAEFGYMGQMLYLAMSNPRTPSATMAPKVINISSATSAAGGPGVIANFRRLSDNRVTGPAGLKDHRYSIVQQDARPAAQGTAASATSGTMYRLNSTGTSLIASPNASNRQLFMQSSSVQSTAAVQQQQHQQQQPQASSSFQSHLDHHN